MQALADSGGKLDVNGRAVEDMDTVMAVAEDEDTRTMAVAVAEDKKMTAVVAHTRMAVRDM